MLSKQKRIIIRIVAFAVIILVLCLTLLHRYKLTPLARFAVPELTRNYGHKLFDGYAVSFALSPDRIYIIDATNGAYTRSYSFDYNGKRMQDFRLPTNFGFWQPYNENCFYYLPESNILAVNNWSRQKMDFFTPQGNYITSRKIARKQNETWLDTDEHNGTKYFLTMGTSKFNATYQINLYSEAKTGQGKLFKAVSSMKQSEGFCGASKQIQLDSYDENLMAISEAQKRKYIISLYRQNKTKTIRIPRNRMRMPWNFADFPSQFVLGKNFMVLGSWTDELTYPLKEKLYTLSGQYVGILKFKDDPQNELVDINGDRLVAFNPATGVISVYRIKVR